MAERRMFSKSVIDSDMFLDMPLSAQALYFHLSMRADDDGFVNNPKKIQRIVGASDDDCKILIAKKFIIPFESGIVVIRHWKIHNYIQKDRYKETIYLDEKAQISIDRTGVYVSEPCPTCIQPVSKVDTQVSIGKGSIDKDSVQKNQADEKQGLENLVVESLGIETRSLPYNSILSTDELSTDNKSPHNPPEGEQQKPKRKRKSDSAEDVEAAVKAFGYPESTNERLREWLEVRSAKRTPNTVSAIQKCIKTLPDMARKSNLGIDAYLDQVIMRGWAAFYEIKAYQPNNSAYSRNPEPPAPQYREAK